MDLEKLAEQDETIAEELMGETVDVAELTEEEGPPTETVEAFPVEEEAEPETVGIVSEEEPTTITGESLEEAVIEEEAAEGIEVGEPYETAEVEEEPLVAGAGWDLVVPWRLGNVLMVAAVVILLLGGAFLLFEMSGIGENLSFTKQFVTFINEQLPSK